MITSEEDVEVTPLAPTWTTTAPKIELEWIETPRRRAVIVDVDGTLALRDEDAPDCRKFWDWHRVGEDRVNRPVADLVRLLARDFDIIAVSGRDDVCAEETGRWLLTRAAVPYVELLMRPHRDNRPDDVVKAEIYERLIRPRYDVAYVLDDRNRVVKMWRERFGLTVLQVADGNF